MTIKNKGDLKTDVLSNYPDNNQKLIAPENDRNQHNDEIDSALNLAETNPQAVAGPVNFSGDVNLNGAGTHTGLQNFTGGLQENGVPVPTAAELAKFNSVYGSMSITQRDTNDPSPYTIAMLAHPSGNDTLNPPAPVAAGPGPFGGYYKIGGLVATGGFSGVSFGAAEIIPATQGDYASGIWAATRHDAPGGATVAYVFGVERAGTITFTDRPISDHLDTVDKTFTTSGGDQVQLLPSDKVSVWVATDSDGTVTIGNARFTIGILRNTTP